MKASEILTQIKTVLGMELSEVEVKFEEKKLDNGTMLEAEAFEKGKSVFIKTEDDEKLALPVGEYTLDDGTLLVVEEEGKIAEMKKHDEDYDEHEDKEKMKEHEDKEMKEHKDKEMKEHEEADVADWKGMEKRIKNLEDAIADLKADKEDKNVKEMEASEQVVEDVKEEEKVEASKTDLSNIEVKPEPISHNPEQEVKKHNVQFAKGRAKNTLDRVLEKLNQ